jgi:hypothetical protein
MSHSFSARARPREAQASKRARDMALEVGNPADSVLRSLSH